MRLMNINIYNLMWIWSIIMVYKTNEMGGVNEKYEEKMSKMYVHVDIFSDILAFNNL